jgi:hypothetical protein
MQKCRFQMLPLVRRTAFWLNTLVLSVVTAVSSITCGAFSSAWAGEASDVFVPMKDSTSNDPAGTQLMIISIGILVTMVLAIFTVTIVFMMKSSKKTRKAPSESND